MKQFEVLFSAEAASDLDHLYSFIAEQSSFEIADGYLARIEVLCDSLHTFPCRGTALPGRTAGLRMIGFERRVTILFRVGEERVDILRVLYGGRNVDMQLEKLI